MTRKHVDLIIIGGGASASASAIRANALGKTVCLFNKGLPLGGTCVNVGCVPSKVVIHAAEVMHRAQNPGVGGIKSEVTGFDFATIIEHELRLVEMMRNKKYKAVLASLQHVTVIEEEATFVDAHTVEAGGEQYGAEHFHIATGSKARVLPIPGLEHVLNLTHIEALKLKKQPKSLVVIGAGPVGLELGQAYARFGTKVTIVQRSGNIFANTEPEVTESLREVLEEDGLTILTNAKTKEISKNGEDATVVVMQGDKELRIDADAILIAVGKIPNTASLNLDKAGVKIDRRKSIMVDQTYRTSAPHIFASGDVAALPMRIETTAGKEGSYVAENAFNEGSKSVDYDSVMYTLFTDSQVAGVGLTEAMAKERGIDCVSSSLPMAEIPKAMIIGDTRGLIKMTIEKESRRILGVHMIGPMAGDIMPYAMMAIRNQNTVDDLVESIPMFPTMAEAIKLVALSFDNDLDQMSCCT